MKYFNLTIMVRGIDELVITWNFQNVVNNFMQINM